ncbi:CbiM family transporter [Limnoglobus roseus]|uniref:CbiM family transporter n=1 Tax=Limnoglobus roseus TaxID=2598579 RepID=UPI00143CFFD9|nr:CbiM family transporter [Limnoglobus roseus]
MFAVHLPDGVLAGSWLAVGWVAAVGLVGVGLPRVSEDQVPRIGLLTAALFVASQLHVPIPVGSVHLLLNAIAGILLGRFVGIAIFIALTFQAFLFAHGGFNSLGINTTVIGLPALGGFALYRLLRPMLARKPRLTFPAGAILGGLVSTATVLGNGFVVVFGMAEGGKAAAITVVLFHLPVIAVESIGTGVLLAYLAVVKPEWIGLAKDQSATGVTSANGTSH